MPRKPAIEGKTRVVRVFVVELKTEMPDTPNLLVFGSKKAIFEYFGNKALKIAYTSALQKDFSQVYENDVCIITESQLLTINSAEVIERRKREGRDVIPSRDLKGAGELTRRKAEAKESMKIRVKTFIDDEDEFVENIVNQMPVKFGARYSDEDLSSDILVAKGTEQDAINWLKEHNIECKLS